jgi:processive 1,2-diacylglycerol beta-glucosyltransferase
MGGGAMDKAKQVLILYASAGHGHLKAAKAIQEAANELWGVEWDCVDTLSLTPSWFGMTYAKSYLYQIQKMPHLWGLFYYATDIRAIYAIVRPFRRLMNKLAASQLEKYVISKKPDVIVTTHFMGNEVTAYLKRKGKIHSKLVTVVTDCMPHCVWMEKATDFYLTAMPETKKELVRRGVPADKVVVNGIPIEKKFSVPHDQAELRKKLGLNEKKFTVLLTSGGAGIGSVEKIVGLYAQAKNDIQLLAICGTNKVLYEKLKKIAAYWNGLKPYGFVNNMDELMGASDLVVGKAGGLTSTESLAKSKPMILIESIPGQEARNARCLQFYGAAYEAKSPADVIEKTCELISNETERHLMREAVSKISHPRSAYTAAEFIAHV